MWPPGSNFFPFISPIQRHLPPSDHSLVTDSPTFFCPLGSMARVPETRMSNRGGLTQLQPRCAHSAFFSHRGKKHGYSRVKWWATWRLKEKLLALFCNLTWQILRMLIKILCPDILKLSPVHISWILDHGYPLAMQPMYVSRYLLYVPHSFRHFGYLFRTRVVWRCSCLLSLRFYAAIFLSSAILCGIPSILQSIHNRWLSMIDTQDTQEQGFPFSFHLKDRKQRKV